MVEPPGAVSRRELASRTARLATAAALPSIAAGTLLPAGAAAQDPGGVQDTADTLLIPAIGLEETLVLVYREAAAYGGLDAAEHRLVVLLGEQSRAHARLLRSRLSEDAALPAAPGEIPGLGPGTPARVYFETALSFSNQLYTDYLDAVGGLEAGRTSLTVAGIAASTAQHLALLRQALGRPPILGAAETGESI